MDIDIAVINAYHEFPLSAEFFFQGKALGKKVVIITPNSYEYEKLSEQGVNTIYTNHFFPGKKKKNFKKKFLVENGIEDLCEFIETEKAYYNDKASNIKRYVFKYAYAFETIFKSYNIKKIFQFQGGEVVRRTATLMAKKYNVKVIYIGESFIPGTTTLYSDEYKTIIEPREPIQFSLEEAKKVIKNKTEERKIIKYKTNRFNYRKGNKIFKFFCLLKNRNLNILRSYFYHIYKRKIKYKWMESSTRPFFEDFDGSQKYFYFPFNVAAESELFIRNRPFVNQVSTVKRIAEKLPKGYLLYVKTHPGDEGHLSISDYRRLKKMENVFLLKSTQNSFEIVEKSVAVIIVSSTVGLESYIMKKPTVVLGNWPYKTMGNFLNLESFERINETVDNAELNRPEEFLLQVSRKVHRGHLFGTMNEFQDLVKTLFDL